MPRFATALPLLLALASIASAQHQGYTPDEAIKHMKLPEGFSARCVASEPMIRQPVSISFDSQGRLWVLQYLQYPNYAGLKPVTAGPVPAHDLGQGARAAAARPEGAGPHHDPLRPG